MIKDFFNKEINIYGAVTTLSELIREIFINFSWGFVGNSIVLFISKEVDIMIFVNFIVYYSLMSYIFSRNKYQTRLGKFIVLHISSSFGAFTGYKVSQWISSLI